ncbi:hypothetical protein IQ07DRAFT_396714 [Pyrenochaeta sp. DS3sAY3a]|nr:hypothetical protein IQ07DRAFT_396714 [Pyrenochaeta sp. DS3sAY3a]
MKSITLALHLAACSLLISAPEDAVSVHILRGYPHVNILPTIEPLGGAGGASSNHKKLLHFAGLGRLQKTRLQPATTRC